MTNKEKVHQILDQLEKMCSYLELEPIDIYFDGLYYFIAKKTVEIIDEINKEYNVKIRKVKNNE